MPSAFNEESQSINSNVAFSEAIPVHPDLLHVHLPNLVSKHCLVYFEKGVIEVI